MSGCCFAHHGELQNQVSLYNFQVSEGKVNIQLLLATPSAGRQG